MLGWPKVWGATAFKGAAEPDAVWTPLHQRFANHLSWLEKAQDLQGERRALEAIVVTGWSRFSHNSALCETLPVGLPSLFVCLQMLRKGHFSSALIETAATELGIPEHALLFDNTSMDVKIPEEISGPVGIGIGNGNGSAFPGSALYFLLSRVEAARQLYLKIVSQAELQTLGCAGMTKDLLQSLDACVEVMEGIRDGLFERLAEVFYREDAEEIMATKFDKVLGLIEDLRTDLVSPTPPWTMATP